MIPAHDSPLASMAFDADGTKLATASTKVSYHETLGLLVSENCTGNGILTPYDAVKLY